MPMNMPTDAWVQVPDDPKGDSAHLLRFVGQSAFRYWPESMLVIWRGKTYKGVHPDNIEAFIANRTDR